MHAFLSELLRFREEASSQGTTALRGTGGVR